MTRRCARMGCARTLPRDSATQRRYCSARCQVAQHRFDRRVADEAAAVIPDQLEAAAVAFHQALAAAGVTYHSHTIAHVDANSYAVVEALLAAGWTPPN